MKDKYVIINISCDEVYFVEMTSSQMESMRWLTDKLDIGYISFIKVDKDFTFKEI